MSESTHMDLPTQMPAAMGSNQVPSLFVDMKAFEDAQRVAKMLTTSALVPKEFQGPQGLSNTLIALEMAGRMGASPLAVMQNLYIVHGKPSWSSQFLIAALNATGRYSSVAYKVEGEGQSLSCIAWVTDKSTGERVEGPKVTMKMANDEGWTSKNGSKWKTMPDLMIRYRAATFLVRLVAPELTMGLHTREEQQDMRVRDMGPAEVVGGSGIEALKVAIQNEPEVPAATFAELEQQIQQAKAPQDLQSIVLSAGHLPADQQSDLTGLAKARAAELDGGA